MVVPSRKLLAPDAVRALSDTSTRDSRRRSRSTLETILLDPEHGKALKTELLGLRSVLVGRLRIIYRMAPIAIDLVAIGSRRTVYEETVRLLRRETEENPH